MTVVVTISSHDDRAYVFQSLKDLLRCGLNLCSFPVRLRQCGVSSMAPL